MNHELPNDEIERRADSLHTQVVGVDIGGTQVRAALVVDGYVTRTVSLRTPARDGAEAVITAAGTAIEAVRTDNCVGVGIASAGVINPADGSVVSATDLIAGWAGTPLAEKIRVSTGLEVRVVNDVHGHALGELHHGAGRNADSMLLVAAGTGLGGAWVSRGQLILGAHHLTGHLGHVPCAEAAGLRCSCGATSHLETVASGSGLEALHERLHPGQAKVNSREIAEQAEAGVPEALETIRTSGGALGAAIGGWCNLLDPEIVVITGGLAHAGNHWWNELRQARQANALAGAKSTPVVRAERPDDAALLGAATLFTHPIAMTGDHS